MKTFPAAQLISNKTQVPPLNFWETLRITVGANYLHTVAVMQQQGCKVALNLEEEEVQIFSGFEFVT